MKLSSSSSSPQPVISNKGKNIPTVNSISLHSDPTLDIQSSSNSFSNPNQTIKNGGKLIKKKKRVSKPFSASTSSSTSHPHQQKGLRIMGKSKSGCGSKVTVNGSGDTQFDSLALPLGMSIAAFVSQVLDRNDEAVERISTDHLSLICTSAVKESLANVFGHRFDHFVENFGESFGCTLKTLRSVKEASLSNGEPRGRSTMESINSEASQSTYLGEHSHGKSSSVLKCSVSQSASLDGHRNDACSSLLNSSAPIPTGSGIYKSLDFVEVTRENLMLDAMDQELVLHGGTNQQITSATNRKLDSGSNDSMLNTFQKSVMEQARSNDLKAFEIGLRMKQLQLEESQLALFSDSNRLERFKLSMGISKASFKAEKFKTQLEETRHAELLKNCIDCLVTGMFIMSASLMYGVYVYSYDRISEVTTSCSVPPKAKGSWWMPKSVAFFHSGAHMLGCQAVVWSRMLFGIFIILAIAYLLLQRSSTSTQTMPVTNIFCLLGILCGIVGKLCVDTLGGSGYNWLLFWETTCLLHFLVNTCTSSFFMILHGPVSASQGIHTKPRLPYWFRRFVFYSAMMVLPLLCGLMPFAGPGDWKDHFISLATDSFFGSVGMGGS